MRKKVKVAVVMALFVAMVVGCTGTTSAATPRITSTNISTTWTTVLSSSTGFNRDVHVKAITTSTGLLETVKCDIRLLDKNGNAVWSQNGAVPGNNVERTFWCGSDVYKVQMRTQARTGVVSAW